MRQGVEGAMFRTEISAVAPGSISVRGFPIAELIEHAGWVNVIALVVGDRRLSVSECRLLEAVLVSAADHGFAATCTAAARYAASGSGSLMGGVAAGLLSLGSHTAVPGAAAAMLLEIAETNSAAASVTDAMIDAVVGQRLRRGERIPGFGHWLHRELDPRTVAIREVAQQCCRYEGYIRLVDRVTERVAVLRRPLPLNVDGIIAAALLDMGFSVAETEGITGLALMPSLIGHVLEEIRTGRPARIIPEEEVEYVTSIPREWAG